jgi:ABC-type branched-subunit amino acid transport system ATPase component
MSAGQVLEVDGLSVSFGNLHVLEDVSFDVEAGSIKGMIGPNGAGKTTLLNSISGSVRPRRGSIRFGPEGVELTSRSAHARTKLGIGRTFQHSNLFEGLTVLDQLLCGGYSADKGRPLATIARPPGGRRREAVLKAQARHLMADLGLSTYENSQIDKLPGALRRMVDLGRALMTGPSLLLLDEIAAGTTQEERAQVVRVVRQCQVEGMAVIVIEHDLEFMRELARDVVVLAEGHVIAAGDTNEVLSRPEVLEAYVGTGE